MPNFQTNLKNKNLSFLNILKKIVHFPGYVISRISGLTKRKKLGAVVLVILIIGLIAGLSYYYFDKYSKPNESEIAAKCQGLIDETQTFRTQKQYQSKYNELQAEMDACNQKLETKADKNYEEHEIDKIIRVAEYNGELAKAAYLSGDKQKAKQLAKEALKIEEALTKEQLSKMSQAERLIFFAALIDINTDTYSPGRTAP